MHSPSLHHSDEICPCSGLCLTLLRRSELCFCVQKALLRGNSDLATLSDAGRRRPTRDFLLHPFARHWDLRLAVAIGEIEASVRYSSASIRRQTTATAAPLGIQRPVRLVPFR
jgi:hypothetical protein